MKRYVLIFICWVTTCESWGQGVGGGALGQPAVDGSVGQPAAGGPVGQPVADGLSVVIDLRKTDQVIDNIGASGCWFSENIGKYWPSAKKEQIARWLFSKEMDAGGNPLGIGLSAWRFNIGGGTAEQGDSSGIRDPQKRVECFLGADGRYDWSKQAGYTWFVQKARAYGVENLIAFVNTPPVQFTKNGLGYKTEKEDRSNLREDRYGAYAGFLADVLSHFEKEGLPFRYISPVNEPQWDWMGKPGSAKQEGSPWRNEEIYRVTAVLDSVLTARRLKTHILVTEAGQLNYLYGGSGATAHQVQTFFGGRLDSLMGAGAVGTADGVGRLPSMDLRPLRHVGHFIGGHSYFTEGNDSSLVNIRRRVADTAAKYGVDYWETEYSMLADGWREGTKGGRSAMDCALFLAKVVHTDLVVGRATAWQFWNSYEPSRADSNTRYCLVALKPDVRGGSVAHEDGPGGMRNGVAGSTVARGGDEHRDGEFDQTKNLWALGNFSRWVRPGMRRVALSRGDGLTDLAAAQDIMLSAYTDGKGRVVVVAINYTATARPLHWKLDNAGKIRSVKSYVTSGAAEDNLKYYPLEAGVSETVLRPRSVTTFVMDL